MRYKIEATIMGDGKGDWGLFLELNGIWHLHQSYKSRKQAEEAVVRLALKFKVDPWKENKPYDMEG